MDLIDRTKSLISSTFPTGARAYRHARVVTRALYLRACGSTAIFTEIYRRNLWGDPESVSGRGSTLARTNAVRSSLRSVLESVGAKTLLDVACGDFNWMQHVDLSGIEYTGVDVVPELIARNQRLHATPDRVFVTADITRDHLPSADVVLCRDCFIHLSFNDIRSTMENFRKSNSKYVLATTHVSVQENVDTQTGGWRSVNLELPPFNFGPPRILLTEDPELGKCLALWDLAEMTIEREQRL